ncbi:S49 family peptidase [Aurantimonas sp. Leaf443]|uniref:S49 family peptidase n=1 Tax=Aurantimonas sp. Leaf443 TaxID=1736378 RepID=UPI0006FB7B91|nr:S49 family peptidase [Aurantimonas sp. Leaf443]KQT88034.1 peptidase S49 [Aurantimonas sp. Leaf443]
MSNRLRRLLPKRFRKTELRIPTVRMTGAILATGGPLRSTLSLSSVAGPLEKAFAVKGAPAVAIIVNSPGGSPVQSRLIHRRIRDLAEEHGRPVIVYVEDVAASGGYMIACAGDEIVADPSSIVGSIGVVSGSFGFVEAIGKLGIERRLHTAGRNKATLDPFLPERAEDVEHLKTLQLDVHATFIDLVKARRGARLAETDELFSGLFWSGARGLDLGLVDRIGDLRSDLRARFGPQAKAHLIGAPRGLFGFRGRGGAGAFTGLDPASLGAGAAREIVATLEERAVWARYGL